jgi:hypothetical protein
MGIQINGQTDNISAVDGSLTISGAELPTVTNLNATGIITATGFVGNVTGNLNSSGVSTTTTLNTTNIKHPSFGSNTFVLDSSGNINIDSGGVYYDATNNRLAIGTTSPATTLDVNGDVTITDKIIHGGDTNTAIRFPAADTVSVETAGSERLRIDSAGRVGIGNSNPGANLQIGKGSAETLGSTAPYAWISASAKSTGGNPVIPQELLRLSWQEQTQNMGIGEGCAINFAASLIGDSGTFYPVASIASFKELETDSTAQGRISSLIFSTSVDGSTAPTEQMRITSTGDLRFNSGYGSAATAYGCRAWVNFDGTGTVAIRASGNVSSITDNGTGAYTVNFTAALADANYSAVATTIAGSAGVSAHTDVYATGSVAVRTFGGGSAIDRATISVAVFR